MHAALNEFVCMHACVRACVRCVRVARTGHLAPSRNPRGELVAQTGEVVSEQNLLQRKKGKLPSGIAVLQSVSTWVGCERVNPLLRECVTKCSKARLMNACLCLKITCPPAFPFHGLTSIMTETTERRSDADMFLWDYPEFAHTGPRTE